MINSIAVENRRGGEAFSYAEAVFEVVESECFLECAIERMSEGVGDAPQVKDRRYDKRDEKPDPVEARGRVNPL